MWDDGIKDYEDMFRDEYRRLSYKMCDTQYNFNKREYEREVKFLFQDKTYRHYQLGICYFEIPVSLNQTSAYNKLDYIEKHYPGLSDTQLLKIAKFLSKEMPKEEEKPVELTPDEKFEELKNNIKKKNENKRNHKKTVRDWLIKHDNIVNFISFVLAMVTVFVPILLVFQFFWWVGGLI